MLTPTQLTTLKNDILADSVLAAKPQTADGAFDIAIAYNVIISAFFVWRTSVQFSALIVGSFDWTRVDNLSVGKARIIEWMKMAGSIDMAQPAVRAGIEAAFTVAADAPCRLAIYNGGSRPATRAEKLFATGSGTAPTSNGVGPATMTFEGNIQYQDVLLARAS